MERFQEEDRHVDVYEIDISPEAQRGLLSISLKNRRMIADAIDLLALNPRPGNSIVLSGPYGNIRRLTVGDYRVLYGVQESLGKLTIELVRHRSTAYAILGALAISVRLKRYSR